MDFWTAIIAIVAIMAGSSIITGFLSALRPKIKRKDLDALKAEIRRELPDSRSGAGSADHGEISKRLGRLEERLEEQEREIRQLTEENSFLRRLIDKD